MHILELENTQETKTHGNPDFPFNIYPCSIPLDFAAVPDHWHTDMEIIYIKKGSGLISVDLNPYPVEKGDIVCVAPGQLHRIEQDGNALMEYENIIFQLQMLMSSMQDISNEQFLSPLLLGRLHLPVLLAAPQNPNCEAVLPCGNVPDLYARAARCLDEIDAFSRRGDALSVLGIKGKLFEFLYLLLSASVHPDKSRHNSRSLEQMKRILTHVKEHYQECLSIEDMAKASGFSGSHFMKFFKQHMGISFTAYLNDYRLTMAARMLSASSDTIAAIAIENGFDNLSYFNRQFKKKFGMTPSRYKADFS